MGIHERDPCRLTWAISGDFRLVVLGILLYSCVLRTKTRSKIAPWQVQRSFARRICAKAMKSPQTIRRLLARALKMHRCKSVGQNRHVSLPCMPRKRSAARMLSLRQNKRSVFSRTCAGKRHLKSRERGDRKGVNGGKREGERSERESVVTRLNLSLRPNKRSRRVGGHAPPQRHLERSAATTKEGVNGGENGLSEAITRCRPRLNLSSRHQSINDITPIGSSQSSWNSTG